MPKERMQIDFDDWARLAEHDPHGFERRRAEVIEEFIAQAPADKRHRLRCLQWRIDKIRETSSNPVAACMRISQLMWESVTGPRGLLPALESFRAGRALPQASAVRARVVPFRRSGS